MSDAEIMCLLTVAASMFVCASAVRRCESDVRDLRHWVRHRLEDFADRYPPRPPSGGSALLPKPKDPTP